MLCSAAALLSVLNALEASMSSTASVSSVQIYVVVNFSSQVIFLFLLFLGMVMYANAVETKVK